MTRADRPRGEGADPVPELTVVVPTRNESGNVGPLLARLAAALAGVDHEVVVVDDSDDDTPAVLARMRTAVVRVEHRRPGQRAGGLSTAVVAGLRLARGRHVCVMDADLQHPPEVVPELLNAVRGGADLAVASRYVRGGSGLGLAGAWRRIVSRVAGRVARALFAEARASTDPLAGFFCCRRSLVEGRELRPVGFKILLELMVCSPPLAVVDVPLHFAPRLAGESKASLQQGRLYLRHLVSLLRDVPGSARRWKFAAVGLVGLGLFAGVLAMGTGLLGWAPLAAWVPAFMVSIAFTLFANRGLTFADMRRDRDPAWQHYPRNAVVSGAAQLTAFASLLATGWSVLAVGVAAAAVGMAVNAGLNRQLVRRRSRSALALARSRPPWVEPAGLQAPASPQTAAARAESGAWTMARAALDELLPLARADGGAVLRVRGDAAVPLVATAGWPDRNRTLALAIPAGVMERAVRLQRAALWIEAPSTRPQRRRSIAVHSVCLVPLAEGGGQALCAALTRDDPHPFNGEDLAAVLAAVELRRAFLVPPGWATAPDRPRAARWRRRPPPVVQRGAQAQPAP